MTSTPNADDVTAELEALSEQQTAAREATGRARAELAAARAARAAAVVDGTVTAQHVERLDDARDELEVCEDVESELARRRRALADEAPAPASEASGDTRTVRVLVAGLHGRHSCNQPSTGRALMGGEELTLPADDALCARHRWTRPRARQGSGMVAAKRSRPGRIHPPRLRRPLAQRLTVPRSGAFVGRQQERVRERPRCLSRGARHRGRAMPQT